MVEIGKKLIPTLLFVLLLSHAAGARSKKTEQTNDVYVAIKSNGLEGSGTKIDPFDGSTSTKLDAILRGISKGTRVHFGPGTFETAGFSDDSSAIGFSVKPGCKYIGAGPDQTTIRLAAASASNHHLGCAFCASGIIGDVSGAEVRALTIDCNGAALVAANTPDLATYGVLLPGSHNKISSVHLIHVYGHFATGKEAFGLGARTFTATGTGNVIENCVVDNFATGNDYGQMICLNGGVMRNNWVIGQTTETSAYQAYGANTTIESCFALNCKRFLYMDSGDAEQICVKNCHAWGITGDFVNLSPSAGFSHHDVTVTNNTVDFASGGTFLTAHPGGEGAKLHNIYVLNNTATQTSGEYAALNLNQVRNFRSAGNRWLKASCPKQKITRNKN